MLFKSPSNSFTLVLIVFALKSTTISPREIGSTNYIIFMRQRRRSTSSSGAQSSMRLEDGFFVLSRSLKTLYPLPFASQTIDAWRFTCGRLLDLDLVHSAPPSQTKPSPINYNFIFYASKRRSYQETGRQWHYINYKIFETPGGLLC
jgi:hypothetical protein